MGVLAGVDVARGSIRLRDERITRADKSTSAINRSTMIESSSTKTVLSGTCSHVEGCNPTHSFCKKFRASHEQY